MRPGISICLLSLLLFQALFLLPLTQLSLQMHRKEVLDKLTSGEGEKEKMLQLSFHEHELSKLEWKEENEFAYRGRMYDVIEVEKKEDLFVLTVYQDERETRMREAYKALRKASHQEKDKEDGRRIARVQPFKYFQNRALRIAPTPFTRTIDRSRSFHIPEEPSLEVPLPPPLRWILHILRSEGGS